MSPLSAVLKKVACLVLLMHLCLSDENNEFSSITTISSNLNNDVMADPVHNDKVENASITRIFSVNQTSRNKNVSNSPGSRTHINPYPFRVMRAPAPCTDEQLVIVIHSAVEYHTRRNLLRTTWLNRRALEKELGLKVKIVFVTGQSNITHELVYIKYEHEMYKDILQSTFVENYRNNTYKAISYLRWVSSERGCPNASLILKVDDDALLHPAKFHNLKSTIQKVLSNDNEDVYFGRFLGNEVDRDIESKWYVPEDVWPYEKYPIWFQGLAYMLTPHLAAQLYPIALHTKYMHTDDVYIGILVSRVTHAEIISCERMGYSSSRSAAEYLRPFRERGKIFYHVPDVQYFYRYFYLKSSLITNSPVNVRSLGSYQKEYSLIDSEPIRYF